MRSRSARLAIPAAILATAALTLTACSSGDSSDGAAGSVSTPSAPGDGQQAATGTSTGSGSAVSSGSSGTTAASGVSGTSTIHTQSGKSSSAVHACASSQLKVSRADTGVGAGQRYLKLVFTNTAGSSCTLTGYPGVSYVKAAGVQSGNPAVRTGAAYHTVTLAAHGTAQATVHDSNGVGGYTPAQCQLTSVEGIRVYPPNQKAALFLPWKTQHCAGTGIHPLTIAPVVS